MKFKDIEPKIRGCITKGIRDAFKRSLKYKACKHSARVEKPKYKLDGSLSKKPQVFYRCNKCKKLYKENKIQVDHIIPVIILGFTLSSMDINTYMHRVFNTAIQVLCKECHLIKSNKENKYRRELKSKLLK